MKVALFCSEPLRARMAGIGIRYLELARRLPAYGFTVVLVNAGPLEEVPETGCELRPYGPRAWTGVEAAVVQGELADPWLRDGGFQLPVAVDLYDPWLVENFVYLERLGLKPFQRNQASWRLHMSRGDFFLCSCEEQRLFYLGHLAALGRVHPTLAARDPDFRSLIDCVPFGLPEVPPGAGAVLPLGEGPHLLFGSVYDWYDPLTLVEALAGLADRPWQLHFMRNPNPASTPQQLLARVEERCRQQGWWGQRVHLHDWVPVERRFDLLAQMDALVCPHQDGLEARLSLRTRTLESLAAGCPVLVSAGGGLSGRIAERRAGWVVPVADVGALQSALRELLGDAAERERRRLAGRELAREFAWERVLAPLVRFLQDPRRDPQARLRRWPWER